jgi:hypothetical protein
MPMLKNLKIRRVDLVDHGANFDPETGDGAHVLLYKRAGGIAEHRMKQIEDTTWNEVLRVAKAQSLTPREVAWAAMEARAQEIQRRDPQITIEAAHERASRVDPTYGDLYRVYRARQARVPVK